MTMKHTWMRFVAVVAVMMAMAPAGASAAPDAGVVGNGTPASCDSNALQTALNGGGLVTFNCGAAPHTLISNTYIISANTVVDGANKITLNGESLRQHFRVNAGVSLTLRNINLTNGSQPQGGSIYNQGTLVVENAAFTNNTTTNDGGAIFNLPAGTVIINGATFSSNKAPLASGYGGAISSQGVLTVTGATFTQNEARYGGAIFIGGSSRASIASSAFNTNKAQLYGGGLYMNNAASSVTIVNASFDKNTANFGAGVNRGDGALAISHASFTDNAASNATFGGGGLYIENAPSVVKVTNATFSGNTTASAKGGGIYNRGKLELVNVTLKNNQNNLFTANGGPGTLTSLRNTALDTNGASLNCDSGGVNVTSGGNNFANDNSCLLNAPTDQTGTTLVANLNLKVTGFTTYYPPLAGSQLINKGANCPTFDQRFAVRIDTCDVGAIEAGGLTARSLVPIAVR
jgi:predicted outer membrane repeat protein